MQIKILVFGRVEHTHDSKKFQKISFMVIHLNVLQLATTKVVFTSYLSLWYFLPTFETEIVTHALLGLKQDFTKFFFAKSFELQKLLWFEYKNFRRIPMFKNLNIGGK